MRKHGPQPPVPATPPVPPMPLPPVPVPLTPAWLLPEPPPDPPWPLAPESAPAPSSPELVELAPQAETNAATSANVTTPIFKAKRMGTPAEPRETRMTDENSNSRASHVQPYCRLSSLAAGR